MRFKLNNKQFIKIVFPCSKNKVFGADEIKIIFHNDDKDVLLFENDSLLYGINLLVDLLQDAIHKKLILHESIKKDLGFLWNEYLQDKTKYNFVKIKCEPPGPYMWIGTNHLLWEGGINELDTWLYNKSDAIVFEITPVYKWHFVDPEKDEIFISYEKFIKNYKPIFITTIPLQVAKKWLIKAENLLKIAQGNDEKVERK